MTDRNSALTEFEKWCFKILFLFFWKFYFKSEVETTFAVSRKDFLDESLSSCMKKTSPSLSSIGRIHHQEKSFNGLESFLQKLARENSWNHSKTTQSWLLKSQKFLFSSRQNEIAHLILVKAHPKRLFKSHYFYWNTLHSLSYDWTWSLFSLSIDFSEFKGISRLVPSDLLFPL